MYKHTDINNNAIDLPVGKVVCVGQNYADHIAEMNSKVDKSEALLFMKPNTAIVDLTPSFSVPDDRGECHNETELAVLIGKPLSKAPEDEIESAIWGYGVGLDLTLREVQAKAKKIGRPWERAKSFDGSCPLSPFVAKNNFVTPQQTQLTLQVNGETRQDGSTAQMIRSVNELISEISQVFTLLPGDVVLTGTPAGVGPLKSGDKLVVSLAEQYQFETEVN